MANLEQLEGVPRSFSQPVLFVSVQPAYFADFSCACLGLRGLWVLLFQRQTTREALQYVASQLRLGTLATDVWGLACVVVCGLGAAQPGLPKSNVRIITHGFHPNLSLWLLGADMDQVEFLTGIQQLVSCLC